MKQIVVVGGSAVKVECNSDYISCCSKQEVVQIYRLDIWCSVIKVSSRVAIRLIVWAIHYILLI